METGRTGTAARSGRTSRLRVIMSSTRDQSMTSSSGPSLVAWTRGLPEFGGKHCSRDPRSAAQRREKWEQILNVRNRPFPRQRTLLLFHLPPLRSICAPEVVPRSGCRAKARWGRRRSRSQRGAAWRRGVIRSHEGGSNCAADHRKQRRADL